MSSLPRLPGIPSISPVQDTTIAAILRPMKESIEILGGAISGNPLPNGTTISSGLNPAISLTTITNVYDGATDTTVPPTASGLTISSGFTNILLSWTDPNVSGTFLNYAYTEVWRSVDNVLANAKLQGFAPGAVYSDPVGTSKSFYYWIRFVSQADIAGPYNSSIGTLGGTGLVGGVDLGPLIVDATKLAAEAVESGKIKDAAITTTKIANLAVGNAAIANLAVSNAKIANLAVDDAKISDLSVNKLTAGSVSVGQYIQSTGFSSGTNGWKIDGNGSAEFGSASIRGQITAAQIDSRGLSIKNSSGTVIFAAGTNLEAQFINPAAGWLNSALVPSITTAQNTADSAASTANSASSTANTANTNASSALSQVAGKLSKAGDTITGRVTFSVADGMFAGTNTSNGVYFGSTGLIGRKGGVNTFYIDTAGDAVFGGSLSAATGSFAGSMAVGSSPTLVSGPNMTGSGANIYSNGSFVLGNAATNISFNGSTMKLNGDIVNTNSIPLGAISTTVSATGAINFTFTGSTSTSVSTAATTFPVGTVINCFFTAVKVDFGAGDINLLLNLRTSSGTLVATFLGQSGLEAVQTMGPGGDKVTATFTGTYVIPFDGSFVVEAYIYNGYGNSWTCKHADLIVLASKR
jgi:hypothetical protein